MFYKARNIVTEFIDDYLQSYPKQNLKELKEQGFKINSKKINFKKAGNNSEKL